MKNKYKFSIPVEKRIILHLANYTKYKNKLVVVHSLTQQGIAENVGIRLEHVSRSMKKLKEKDIIFTRTAKVKNNDRRKKVYFLTENGIKYAKDIENQFHNRIVLIHTLEDELREIKFNELNEFINIKITPLEAHHISSRSDEGIIDLNKFNKVTNNPKKH